MQGLLRNATAILTLSGMVASPNMRLGFEEVDTFFVIFYCRQFCIICCLFMSFENSPAGHLSTLFPRSSRVMNFGPLSLQYLAIRWSVGEHVAEWVRGEARVSQQIGDLLHA